MSPFCFRCAMRPLSSLKFFFIYKNSTVGDGLAVGNREGACLESGRVRSHYSSLTRRRADAFLGCVKQRRLNHGGHVSWRARPAAPHPTAWSSARLIERVVLD